MESRVVRFTFGLAFLLAIGVGCAAVQTAEKPDWKFHTIVDESFVRPYATVPQPKGVMIVDSRALKPKYVNGHIPTSVCIPDSQFEELKSKLPEDKTALLIFYCEGSTWKLSHNSAWKAEKLGYRNVKVFDEGFPGWMKGSGNFASVAAEYVAAQLDTNGAVLIDSRARKAKFDQGHIPSAVSIPDSDFAKLSGRLPRDGDTPLIFYCEGYTWRQSHDSARSAVKLGYKNVTVFSGGYPAWVKEYGAGSKAVAAKAGKNEGTIDIAAFEKILKENPNSVYLIDVRDPKEFEAGHLKGAINMPVKEVQKQVKTLPSDKPIIFVCATGARSGECFYMLQDLRKDLKKVSYVDADMTYNKDGSYKITPKK